MFRARLPLNFITSHKMPCVPRYLRLVATSCSPVNAICRKTRNTSKVLRLPRKMTMDTSKVLRLPRKLQCIFWKRHKKIAPATQSDFRHVTKHTTRNEATRGFKPPKMNPFCRTCHRHSHRAIARTVANDCGRKRNVKRTHPQPPDPQGKTGTLRIQEKGGAVCHLTFGFSGPPYFFPPHFQTIKAIFQNLLSNIVTTLPLQHLEVGKHCIPLNFKDKIYIFGKYIYTNISVAIIVPK